MALTSGYTDAEAGLKTEPTPDVQARLGSYERPLSVMEAEASDLSNGMITKRGLKSRHAQMIAIGGAIGTG